MKQGEKGLSVWQLTMLALGTVVGGSFFLGSSVAIRAAGPSVLLSYVIGGILVYFILSALSEMTVANPVAGSFRTYTGQLRRLLAAVLLSDHYGEPLPAAEAAGQPAYTAARSARLSVYFMACHCRLAGYSGKHAADSRTRRRTSCRNYVCGVLCRNLHDRSLAPERQQGCPGTAAGTGSKSANGGSGRAWARAGVAGKAP